MAKAPITAFPVRTRSLRLVPDSPNVRSVRLVNEAPLRGPVVLSRLAQRSGQFGQGANNCFPCPDDEFTPSTGLAVSKVSPRYQKQSGTNRLCQRSLSNHHYQTPTSNSLSSGIFRSRLVPSGVSWTTQVSAVSSWSNLQPQSYPLRQKADQEALSQGILWQGSSQLQKVPPAGYRSSSRPQKVHDLPSGQDCQPDPYQMYLQEAAYKCPSMSGGNLWDGSPSL